LQQLFLPQVATFFVLLFVATLLSETLIFRFSWLNFCHACTMFFVRVVANLTLSGTLALVVVEKRKQNVRVFIYFLGLLFFSFSFRKKKAEEKEKTK
jgi:hypothetical protein